ncbi:MAG: PIN domain-containing protein [Candidatus Nomurabacteria bacterium]|jgi:predicted nucleic acid-binding protein|nr:PIN domain-containing protein [Candidatus Nomurabacteria bacterium]
MDCLIDTNVIIDVLAKRANHVNSGEVLKMAKVHEINGYVSVKSILDIIYVLRKQVPLHKSSKLVGRLLSYLKLVELAPEDILDALAGNAKDFEDATLASIAKRHRFDYIITNNVKDFPALRTKVISPKQFLQTAPYSPEK